MDGFETSNDVLKGCIEAARLMADGTAPFSCLTILGKPGVGKTHVAAAIINHRLARAHQRCALPIGKFVSVPAFLQRLRASYSDSESNSDEIWERYANAPLLVLDDLGSERHRAGGPDWAWENIFRLIDHRYAAGDEMATVVTTNVPDDLIDRVADRLLDVGTGWAEVISLRDVCSYRSGR